VREGTDVTVVSVSRVEHEALAAASALAGRGISVEVIDLRTVAPPPTPSPYAPNLEKPNLEKLWLPDRGSIERAVEQPVAV
jgi:hypothetical protein